MAPFRDKINDKLYKVEDVETADGGWTAMDYFITLEKEVN